MANIAVENGSGDIYIKLDREVSVRTALAMLTAVCLVTSEALAVEKRDREIQVTDEKSADQRLKEADQLFQERNYETALEHYREAAKSAGREFNYSVEVEALSQVARMNLLLGDKNEGKKVLAQVAGKARESDPYGWSRFLGVRGRFEWQDNDLKVSFATFDQMYDYCGVNSLWGRAVDAAHMMAIVAENPEQQIKWGRKGLEIAEANDVESWLGPLWNNLAGTYYDMKNFDSTLQCYIKAREYHWRHSGEVAKLFADYHVGMAYRLTGGYEKAGQWLRPVLAWAERLQNHSAIGQACEDLGEVALATGKTDDGKKLFQRAKSEYDKAGFEKSWPEIYNNVNKQLAELK